MKPAPPVGERRLDLVPLDELLTLAAEVNPKAHDVEGVAEALGRFGYGDTILVDERDAKLASGHGRTESLAVLRDSGEPPPDGVKVVRGKGWCVPVVRGWRSPDGHEGAAYRLAANRLGERAGWDPMGLAETLRDLAEYDADLVTLAGWSEAEQDAVIARLANDDDGGYDGPKGQDPPEDFPSYGEGVDADYRCPVCKHSWNGNPKP